MSGCRVSYVPNTENAFSGRLEPIFADVLDISPSDRFKIPMKDPIDYHQTLLAGSRD